MQPERVLAGPQPINRLLVASFLLVAVVPLAVLGFKLYDAAWEEAWREIREKHQLLARNLASPISIYIQDHRRALGLAATLLPTNHVGADARTHGLSLLQELGAQMDDFAALAWMDPYGNGHVLSQGDAVAKDADAYASHLSYRHTLTTGKPHISGITLSPSSRRPVVILSHPVLNAEQHLTGVLLAELRIQPIERLRRNIRFGLKGHSAIVDHTGHVVAHPNPDWMEEMRDLSHLSVVQRMMRGETGVTEFHSPFVQADMVAGYTTVPEIGWGVMVPQPRAEVEAQVKRLLTSHLNWALSGLIIAIVLAIVLARWITGPLNRLAASARRLMAQDCEGSLDDLPERAPREVLELGASIGGLVDGLQLSRDEIGALNDSLQQRVEEATAALQAANERLQTALARSEEFMSFARHDLRKPIFVISDIADTLREELENGESEPDAVIAALELMAQSARYMQRLTDDFLGQAIADQASLQVSRRAVHLNDLAHLTLDSNRGYAGRKQVRLESQLQSDLPPLYVDDARIAQVFHNLVDNGIKFARAGETVSVVTSADPRFVTVEVKDTGPGLSEEDLRKVFIKHARLSNRPTGGERSTGLGLAICKAVIEQHGGSIGVRNNRDRGCTFWFRLPRARLTVPARQARTA